LKPFNSIRIVRWSEAHDALSAVRTIVFIREQSVPEELEWDGLDESATHFLAEGEECQPIGTARLLADGQIGRMAVLAPWRRRGVGRAILDTALRSAKRRGMDAVWLHAQTHAVSFYQRMGFEIVSGEFLEADIPHVLMRQRLPRIHDPAPENDDSTKR
jgi:predicted GNAT family N-acyltransferase